MRSVVYVLLAAPLAAQVPLTTVQDVIYKADGTRFNGYAEISWRTFEAVDQSYIAKQFTTVRILGGVFRVQLVPSVNANPPTYYLVKYHSDGRSQYEERWMVPHSGGPLRIRDVRMTAAPVTESGGSIEISDVTGLNDELTARPVKATAFVAGRAAMINLSGALESVPGNPADCVRVDGTSGPCGTTGGAVYVDPETLTGVVDGANLSFTLTGVPNPSSSLMVYRNGILQQTGVDYTAVDHTVSFLPGSVPQPGDKLMATYRVSGAGGALSPAGPQVLCSGTGLALSSTTLTALATCAIPAGTLQAGDRVEMRFDYAHEGTAVPFSIEVRWGSTVFLQRTGGAGNALLTGKAEAGLSAAGAQVSVESWGDTLGSAYGVVHAPDTYTAGVSIPFLGKLDLPGSDQVSLRSYTVVRYPRVP